MLTLFLKLGQKATDELYEEQCKHFNQKLKESLDCVWQDCNKVQLQISTLRELADISYTALKGKHPDPAQVAEVLRGLSSGLALLGRSVTNMQRSVWYDSNRDAVVPRDNF
jgi:hypothetical protein